MTVTYGAARIPEALAGREVNDIMFFGGEPLLTPSAIAAVCEGFTSKQRKPPAFSIITNGTVFNDEVKELLTRYNFKVIVSIDGPEEIHDRLRPYASGAGSYQKVASTIAFAKAELSNPVCFECKYTQAHEQAGISPVGLLELIKKEFGLSHGTLGYCTEPRLMYRRPP